MGRVRLVGDPMKLVWSIVSAALLIVTLSAPAFAQGGMGDGTPPGGPGGRGPSRGPEQPGGNGSGGEEKKEEPAKSKAQIENMEIHLRFFPTDLKSCEAVEKALSKVALVKKIAVAPGEARTSFTGNWDQLAAVQAVHGVVKLKEALVTPGIFTVDCAPARSNPRATAAEALMKVQGVNKSYGEGTRITVYGSVA